MRPHLFVRLLTLLGRLLICAAGSLLGTTRAGWARAMHAELATLDSPREALPFAWGCLGAAVRIALADISLSMAPAHRAGLAAGGATVLLGGGALLALGAPGAVVGMNLASLLVGVLGFGLLPLGRWQHDGLLRARLCAALGAVLLAAALGPTGAWLPVGPVHLNLLWLLLPALLLAADPLRFASPQPGALCGLLMATAALALLAEGALAGLMAVLIGVQAARHRSAALTLIAAAAAATALHVGPGTAAAEATRCVDGVVFSGFEHSLALGLAMALLQLLPLWPAVRHRAARGHGLVWVGLVALSLAGWMPSPLVGLGGSLIVGYLLSLALLPADAPARPTEHPSTWPANHPPDPPIWPRSGLT